ncbi:hypothetical protein LCGC14_0712530 [marine sediment metagenome]|uniref:Uncharacterized protein n=1 Tax=marine sediment metagenome TaxID=412755 RepID=A0A0F9R003_9ZZZZ
MPVWTESLARLHVSNIVKHEIPTPTTDGATTVFTVANPYESGTLEVFRDQSVLLKGSGKDFEDTTTTTFTVASVPDADEVLWVSYIKA